MMIMIMKVVVDVMSVVMFVDHVHDDHMFMMMVMHD